MKQETHSWIAIRAIALLADKGGNKNLVRLLGDHACEASVGAWIPDSTDAKSGGSATENHIFKMKPFRGKSPDRFVADKAVLLKRLGPARAMSAYLADDNKLDPDWWAQAYKADPMKPGQHLPNRAMAMSTMLKDLLLLGDESVDSLVGRGRIFDQYTVSDAQTRQEALAAYFFMLSHFIADSCMPCHCDARDLSAYGKGLHKQWEEHWSKAVAAEFAKDALIKKGAAPSACIPGDQAMEKSRGKDKKFGLDFGETTIPSLPKGRDVWLEMVDVCRASFALASIVAPPAKYGYGDTKARARFDAVLAGKPILKELDRVIMHDAVLNTAMVWKNVWQALGKKPAKKK